MAEQKRNWVGVNSDQVAEQLADPQFIHRSCCPCGAPLHTFRKPGEFLEGRLRPCKQVNPADRAGTVELAYYTATGQESIIAVRLSKMLRATLYGEHGDIGRLWGQWIRITYVGSKATRFGHAQKIYLIEVDKGSITPAYQEVPNNERPTNPTRPRRKIRRPAVAK